MIGNRRINPFALLLLGTWLLWGFGVQALGRRLTAEVYGVVIASRETPSADAPRGITEYTIRGDDGQARSYIAGPTYGSLPRSMPIGTRIRKQRWHVEYERDGRLVNDFSLAFTAAILAIACGCVLWGVLSWRDRSRGAA